MSSKNAEKERILVQEVVSQTGPGVSPVQRPSREEIRRRAFEIHIERAGSLDVTSMTGSRPNGNSKILRTITETQSEKSRVHDNSELQND